MYRLPTRLYLLVSLFSAATLPVRSDIVAPSALNLRITANLTHEIPSTLYGLMWEVRLSIFLERISDSDVLSG